MDENNINNNEENVNDNMKSFRVPEETENGMAFYKNIVIIFFATLVIGVIFISTFLKNATPNMDLDIGENPVASMNQRGDEQYDDDDIRMQIDQRLKMIQNEEDMPGVSEKNIETEESKIIDNLRAKSDNSYEKDVVGKPSSNKVQNTESQIDIEPVSIPTVEAPKPNYISKIYIGQFSDKQKALEMQENISASGVNVTTIIKEVNGYYTIQAGVFSSYESAKVVADHLNNAGFSAKIVKEIR